MSTRSTRAARGAAFAAFAGVSAATAHTLAGGGAPSPLFCALLAVLALPLTTALAGARVALWRTAAAMGGAQLLFHAAFSSLGDIGRWGAVVPHDHGAMPAAVVHLAADADPMAGGANALMVIAHALAAAVSILAVHRGERMVRFVTGWLPRMLRRVLGLVVAPLAVPIAPPPEAVPPASPRRLLAGSVSRRGPPALVGLP